MIRNAALWRCALVGAALIFSVDSPAQTNCPWMNTATAAGVLDEPVNATVIRANKNSEDATCDFTPLRPAATPTLHIAVITMSAPGQEFATYSRQCGSDPTPLKAIGNEAVECTQKASAGESVVVVGRVRDRVFVVTISDGPATPQPEQLERAKSVAEQVSEALY